MSKASEAELGELHGTIARTLTQVVQVREIEVDGKVTVLEPSAAHVMAAITFLKNNNITADAEANQDLAELNKKLAERRKQKKLTLTDLNRAADELDRDLGGHMQ